MNLAAENREVGRRDGHRLGVDARCDEDRAARPGRVDGGLNRLIRRRRGMVDPQRRAREHQPRLQHLGTRPPHTRPTTRGAGRETGGPETGKRRHRCAQHAKVPRGKDESPLVRDGAGSNFHACRTALGTHVTGSRDYPNRQWNSSHGLLWVDDVHRAFRAAHAVSGSSRRERPLDSSSIQECR